MYEMVANTNKNNHGVADFDAHAIKTSGGIIPKKVSEVKKIEQTTCHEYVASSVFNSELKSRKKYSRTSNSTTKATSTAPPLKAVSFKNG